jgi:hypothetical protein
LRLFLDASGTCTRLWVRQGCAVGTANKRISRQPKKKAAGFDLNQMWLRAVTHDKFFDFEPALSWVIFPARQDGEKSMDQSDGFSRPVRYALSLAFAVAASLLAVLAFGGLPWPF